MQERVDDRIAAQRRCRVRARFAERSLGAATPLDGEDRLRARHAPRDPGEALRIAERLHIEHRHGRPIVLLAPLEQIVGRDVGGAAKRDQHRDPQPPGLRMTEQPDPERGRLRADRQTAGVHARAAERRVQADLSGGVEHPQRARPDHPHARAPDDLQQPLLALGGRRAVVVGTDREHQQRACSAGGRLGRELDDVVARGGDDHELRSDLQLGEAAGGPHRAHHTARAVDRGHRALESRRR